MATLLIIDSEDKNYLTYLSPLVNGLKCKLIFSDKIQVLAQLSSFLKLNPMDNIIVCGSTLLPQFLKHNNIVDEEPSIRDWQGSIVKFDNLDVLFLPNLWHLIKVKSGTFTFKRFLFKFTNPDRWMNLPELRWELADFSKFNDYIELFSTSLLTSIDIETHSMDITCVGYTGLFETSTGKLTSYTVVVPYGTMEAYQLVKALNELPTKKVFQNGNYDNTYFLRWDSPVTNYVYDTYHMMHSWLVELPKDLGFIAAFFIRDFRYWKFEASSHNKDDLYFYNAKDCHATLWSCVAMLLEMPEWAETNYLMEFPIVFPSIHCGIQGMKVDEEERQRLLKHYDNEMQITLSELQKMCGAGFNPRSPDQVLRLFHALGQKKLTSTNKAAQAKFEFAHPLNERIVGLIKHYRTCGVIKSTFLDYQTLNGRLVYALNPAGTETGRLAANKAHFSITTTNKNGKYEYEHFGVQLQNITGDVKSQFIADDGYVICEPDYSQSESRTTAYITGDKNLIASVESPNDFHCTNASKFFGRPIDKKKDKDLRDLGKRVNHGANYLMGDQMLVDTMTPKLVRKAQELLKLPKRWRLTEVTHHLLRIFEKTYPDIHGRYLNWLVNHIENHGIITLPCPEFPWTRKTFLKPRDNKLDKNAMMAHCPQSLSVMKANYSFYRIWKKFQIDEKRIRVIGQVHDSIPFQYKPDDLTIVQEVKDIMQTPLTINGVSVVIPADAAENCKTWADAK